MRLGDERDDLGSLQINGRRLDILREDGKMSVGFLHFEDIVEGVCPTMKRRNRRENAEGGWGPLNQPSTPFLLFL